MSAAGAISVLLVDDQPVFRRAVAAMIDSTDRLALVGEAATGEDAVELATRLTPQLVLMDVRLPGIDGLEATRRIVEMRPGTRVLLVSTHDARDLPVGLDSCGAVGFLPKQDLSVEVLLDWA